MPKEWTGPSDYFAAGLYGNQSRKAIFRSLLTPDGHSRGYSAMEFEEAADLTIKRDKSSPFDYRDKKIFPPYGLEGGTMDLSSTWKPSLSAEHRPPHATLQDHRAGRKRATHHTRPHKRSRDHDLTLRVPSVCAVKAEVEEDEGKRPKLNGHLNNGYDSDGPPLDLPPLPPHRELTPEERNQRHRALRLAREELRAEEMKLVLLKKLQQSQLKENVATATKLAPQKSGSSQPPPLVKSGSQAGKGAQHGVPLMCNQNTLGGPPPLIGQRSGSGSCSTVPSGSSSLMSSLIRNSHTSSSRVPVTTPPNIVMGYNVHNLHQTSQGNHHQSVNQMPQACPSPSSQQQQQSEGGGTPAQRQAAAKLALRKQLEKTLLQIPPPKPPPPEMHFVPGGSSAQFVVLVGLEKAVDLLTEDPGANRPPPDPFECVQCATDFSPVWKWQDAGRHRSSSSSKPAVICETCVTSNIKRALKAEHTNRLKTAFVKALQQEQEIEQRMALSSPKAQASPPIGVSPTHTPSSTPRPATPPAATPPAPSHSPVHGLKLGGGSSSLGMGGSLLQHLPKLSAAHQSLLAAQQHFGLPQPAHMFPYGPLLAAQAYQMQHLLGGGKGPPLSSAELQRQYLLDMIPPRSLQQQHGSLNWKT